MLSASQQEWINHLSDKDKIKIEPYDSTCHDKFKKIKAIIHNFLGRKIVVKHCGATSLGISGQNEIDVYLPISPEYFNMYLAKLTQIFGPPRSHYVLRRARFVTYIDEKHIDVFLINKNSPDWTKSLIFEKYLKTHPASLEEYRILKEKGNGLDVREYYRRKIEFINYILEKAKSDF